jgi:peptide/nickel transport system permease protein
MWKFSVRRTIIMIPQLILLSIIIFILAQLMPGDALSGQVGPDVDPERIAEIREEMGWNDPWYEQYASWIGGVVKGDFGQSFRFKMPVSELIQQRVMNTVWLSLVTLVLTYMLAIPLGIVSGRYNDTWKDQLVTGYTYVGFATPLFIFALVMLWLFGFKLGWFPTSGSVTPGLTPGTFEHIMSKVYHLILPALSMALITTYSTIQYLRNEIVDTKQRDFIITARAKGASEKRVYNRHILRNSLLPIAAFFGYEITGLIGGSIFIENIFGFPGMGQLLVESITLRDYSVLTATTLLFGVASILGALISDIILSIVDPRIRIK